MTLFCFLWLPFFYLFRRSTEAYSNPGSVWALLLGSVIAIVQFFAGDLVNPGGFGFSRWLYAWVDMVALPAVIPLLVYFLFVFFKVFSGTVDFVNFALLWLIPGAGIRAVSWSTGNDPVYLILVPVLLTAIVTGIPFFIGVMMVQSKWFIRVPLGLGILVLPFLAATSWWAFFSQRFGPGVLLLAVSVIPAAVSLVLSWKKTT